MDIQAKFDDITNNLSKHEAFYYPKSAFSTDDIQILLGHFNIDEIRMTKELAQGAEGFENIEWTQEWYYIFKNKAPEQPSPLQQ